MKDLEKPRVVGPSIRPAQRNCKARDGIVLWTSSCSNADIYIIHVRARFRGSRASSVGPTCCMVSILYPLTERILGFGCGSVTGLRCETSEGSATELPPVSPRYESGRKPPVFL